MASWVLLILVWLIFIIILSWTAGVSFVYESLKDYVDASKAKQALETIDFYKCSFRTLLIILGGATLYLLGLRFIHDLLERDKTLKLLKQIEDKSFKG